MIHFMLLSYAICIASTLNTNSNMLIIIALVGLFLLVAGGVKQKDLPDEWINSKKVTNKLK